MTTSTTSVPTVSDDDLDRVFMALANRTRRQMLDSLARGPVTIGELAEPFEMSLPGASKHVRVLEQAGLVHREIDGRIHRCMFRSEPLEQADAWINRNSRFWQGQLDALAEHFNNNEDKNNDDKNNQDKNNQDKNNQDKNNQDKNNDDKDADDEQQ